MAIRRQLTIWIPVVLVAVVTVGYVEWRMTRPAEVSSAKERSGAVSHQEKGRSSSVDKRALALAAVANTRAERAEQALLEVKERLEREDADRGAVERAEASESLEEKRERERRDREAFLQALDERFLAEPVDPAWRAEKESALASTGPMLEDLGVTLEEADCASKTCKVRMTHPSHGRLPRDAAMKFLNTVHAAGSPLTHLAFNFKYEEGVTTLYGTEGSLAEASGTD